MTIIWMLSSNKHTLNLFSSSTLITSVVEWNLLRHQISEGRNEAAFKKMCQEIFNLYFIAFLKKFINSWKRGFVLGIRSFHFISTYMNIIEVMILNKLTELFINEVVVYRPTPGEVNQTRCRLFLVSQSTWCLTHLVSENAHTSRGIPAFFQIRVSCSGA